jgi:hypothetical protein
MDGPLNFPASGASVSEAKPRSDADYDFDILECNKLFAFFSSRSGRPTFINMPALKKSATDVRVCTERHLPVATASSVVGEYATSPVPRPISVVTIYPKKIE